MDFVSVKKALALSLLAGLAIACDKTERSFSLLEESTGFKQSDAYVSRKIDFLWVVDNSGSMATSQGNLTSNFNAFINRFKDLGYDFRMSVITTDAYISKFRTSNFSTFRDPSDYRVELKNGRYERQTNSNNESLCTDRGTPETIRVCNFVTNPNDAYHVLPVTFSGVRVMTPNTPDLAGVFVTNATQGIRGSSEERPFESMYDALLKSSNADFRRPDAFLAVIIVSDEDDWSANVPQLPGAFHTGPKDATNGYYTSPQAIPVSFYKEWLDTYAGVGNYSVSAITIDNSLFTVPDGLGGTVQKTCRDILLNDPNNPNRSAQRLGVRIMELANQTRGVVGSICGDFAASLANISSKVLELIAKYKLDREPIIETISVTVNGVPLAQDPVNGWTYDAATMTIFFHGTGVPPAGANVLIKYDPKSAKG